MKSRRGLMAGVVVVTALAVGAIVFDGARAQSSVAATATTSGLKNAEEQYKNIQALKGIPADQLIPGMQFIAASLGVGCEFCHVEGAFEKDDKKTKQTARKMMAMMFAINKDSFDGRREVTCYSCHRGSADPVGMPPVADGSEAKKVAEHKVESGEPSGPPAEQLLGKYLQAVGGAAAVGKNTSRVMKGTITFGDRDVPIDIFAKDPNKRVSFTHTPDGDSVTGFDGHEGWLGLPGRPAREMHGPDMTAAAMDADLHFATHLKGRFSDARTQGIEKIDGHAAYVVVGQWEGTTPLRLYFDEETWLLVRLVRLGETPLGRMPTQIDYADYREAGGVKIPFRWTLARPGGRFTIQLSEVKQNVPLDDAKFVRPASPPAEAKGPAK